MRGHHNYLFKLNFLIIGSGFGLYGYLPAITNYSKKIYLNVKYKKFFFKRKELTKYKNKIIWYEDQQKIIEYIDYLIVAQRPQDQFRLIKKLVKTQNKIKHIFLEKPIGINPNKSKLFINFLNKNKIKFSFGFLLNYLNWYKVIKVNKKKYQSFKFVWQIKKKNNDNSWKYQSLNGGGLIRFYGIHFIKALFDLNFKNIKHNKISKNLWKIKTYDKRGNSMSIELKYSNKDKFIYNSNNFNKVSSINPFGKNINKLKIDPRCFYIKKYIKDNLNKKIINNKYYDFINFWKKVEVPKHES